MIRLWIACLTLGKVAMNEQQLEQEEIDRYQKQLKNWFFWHIFQLKQSENIRLLETIFNNNILNSGDIAELFQYL
jgi:predicted ATPase